MKTWNLILLVWLFTLIWCTEKTTTKVDTINDKKVIKNQTITIPTKKEKVEFAFIKNGLKTNTAKSSIDLEKILDWGPWKDGIPAINKPVFLNIKQAKKDMHYLNWESRWIVVSIKGDSRFYPLNILNWHEIVNDNINGTSFVISFCPLCWTAIVYDRKINDMIINFWVSWKLYESNLLMFDRNTHTLWSQAMWEAVVWDMLGTVLEIIDSDLLSLSVFEAKYPNWKILSDKTWVSRSYGKIPYGDYDNNDILYFPVSNTDVRLPKKELLYIINDNKTSIAFVMSKLKNKWKWEITVWQNSYQASYNSWDITVKLNSKIIPWYTEMWFSWITHNKNSKNIWGIK